MNACQGTNEQHEENGLLLQEPVHTSLYGDESAWMFGLDRHRNQIFPGTFHGEVTTEFYPPLVLAACIPIKQYDRIFYQSYYKCGA